MIRIEKYDESRKVAWENLLSCAVNGTFLHSRNFMDYHRDRFKDASVLVYEDGECVGIFPANYESSGKVISHAGLTYGGLIVEFGTCSKDTMRHLAAILKFFYQEGVQILDIKLVPDFYHKNIRQDIEYGLKLAKGKIEKMDLTCVVNLRSNIEIPRQKSRIKGAEKARNNEVYIQETSRFEEFWTNVLTPNLMKRHGVKPVHTLDEIQYLHDKNEGRIRQFNVYQKDEIIGGTTIFETQTTAHTQYISSTVKGRNLGALDYLFIYLIDEVFKKKKYFDFGAVNEESEWNLNEGLLFWKEGFGARGFVQRHYSVETKNYSLIEQIFNT
ncbi:GNAT family N-acetyltransferase [Balneolaceae bacterium YR4-1]|uniref:GNAT family N-acetyltransferase n=1 Tax=Halalkalibaculum roseum TaxID=2709311 RepID=A0A6M1SXJ7_9BACT|nr:GNAT family N-acetyltransferase [Halalkalibaculum roseum]NGP76696.1 GNAT family N-acetyltransferase [Halalkalibaculum roseum]